MKPERTIKNAKKPAGFWGSRILDSMNDHHNELTEWGLSQIDFEPYFYVLDIGCGGGNALSKMSKMVTNGKLCGIDYSEVSVRKSKQKNKTDIKNGKMEIMQGNVSNMPYKDDTFDVATGIETYYFWPQPADDLKEVKRVLKSNGMILLIFETRSDDNPDVWKDYREIVEMNIPSENGIKEELDNAGFADIKVVTKGEWLCAYGRKPLD